MKTKVKISQLYIEKLEREIAELKAPTKILIQVDDGKVSAVYSNSADVKIVVLDMNAQDKGEKPCSDILPPEVVRENLHELFFEDNAPQREIRDDLKRMKF